MRLLNGLGSAPAAEAGFRLPTVASLRERFYPDLIGRDPVAVFVRTLERSVKPTDDVLDLGAGAGELNHYALQGRVRRLVGIDVDPRVGRNPLLDAGVRGDICALPFCDGSFDVVFSIYVLEHVEHAAAHVREIARVLRPGGRCFVLTPNMFHYVTAMSRVTPIRLHRWVNQRRGRAATDTFPTFYRLNSRGALQRHFSAAGLATVAVETLEVQPNYLTFNAATYALGVAFERMVNATERLASIRVNLIATFEKPVRP